MSRRGWIGSILLIGALVATGGALAAWKYASIEHANAAASRQPEPIESVTVAVARKHAHRETATSIGTVIALRSITLRNELPGTVRQVTFTPGQVVEAGAVLVTLDVSVEEAELRAQEAQAAVAETLLRRVQRASESRAASEMEVDRARADRDVALAQIARIKAIIARKTLRAPFRARVGLADVHPGQYLNEGTQLTTLQGVDAAAHVDFTVAQAVAADLRVGGTVEVFAVSDAAPTEARIVAIDARVDPTTRNAMVRAKIERAGSGPAPGASVRVRVPVGSARQAVAVPVSALRKGPGGDHVFVIAPAKAAFFPQIFLTGFFGVESAALSDLFTGPSRIWQFGPTVTLPIFNAGRNRANLQLTEARQQEALIRYEQTIQQAFREVEDALIAHRKARQALAEQEAAARASREALAIAEFRYTSGLTTYLNVLDAQRALLTAEVAEGRTLLVQLVAVVQLYRALGGGWDAAQGTAKLASRS